MKAQNHGIELIVYGDSIVHTYIGKPIYTPQFFSSNIVGHIYDKELQTVINMFTTDLIKLTY